MKTQNGFLKLFSNLFRGLWYGKQFCFIYENVYIGKNVKIFPGAVIGRPSATSGATKRKLESTEFTKTIIQDNCIIGCNSVIYNGVMLDKGVMICDTACVREDVLIGDYSLIAMGVTINVGTVIGSKVRIMDNCHITGNSIIEDNVFIGMLTTTANDNTMGKGSKTSNEQKGVFLRKGCRIGQGSCIFPGVEIGENSVVGANSTVTKSVSPNTLVMGSPAKVKG